MKELIETCNTGGPMAPLIDALLTGGDGRPLVWRENGPGVGWEMRTAWSGIFRRFFARAFLEEQGYTWFHSIRHSYEPATDDLVVIRAPAGEVADWACARERDALDEGDFVVAEAKARHRECMLELNNLPRALWRALDQIDNTFVIFRGMSGPEFRRTKGIAILIKWTNEEKNSSSAMLRAVDPETSGFQFTREERAHAVEQLARAQISELLHGLGFPAVSRLASPRRQPWDQGEAVRNLQRVREIIAGRSESAQSSVETQWLKREEWLARKRPDPSIRRLLQGLENKARLFPPAAARIAALPRADNQLRKEAAQPLPTARILVAGLDGERFIGSIFGLAGPVRLPLRDVILNLNRMPTEISRHMMFVGIRIAAAEQAAHVQRIRKWVVPGAVRRDTEQQRIYTSSDNVVIAPAGRLEVTRARRIL